VTVNKLAFDTFGSFYMGLSSRFSGIKRIRNYSRIVFRFCRRCDKSLWTSAGKWIHLTSILWDVFCWNIIQILFGGTNKTFVCRNAWI